MNTQMAKHPIMEDCQRFFQSSEEKAPRKCHSVRLVITAFLVMLSVVIPVLMFLVLLNNDLKELKYEVEILKNDVNGCKTMFQSLIKLKQDDLKLDEEENYNYADYDARDENYNMMLDQDLDDESSMNDPSRNKNLLHILSPSKLTKDLKDNQRAKRNIIDTNEHSSYNYGPYNDNQQNLTETTTAFNISQPIEIMSSPHPASRKGKLHKKAFPKSSNLSRQSEENPDVEPVHQERFRHRQRQVESFDERPARANRMRPLPTAHFHGDTSKYVYGVHDNFNGDGHLRHPTKTYVDWLESSWFRALGMDRHFGFDHGALTIRDSGLYFVYAQIYYYDAHDINGFMVYKNNKILLQCTTMTHSVARVMKGNTCYTAAAEYLQEGDSITLADMSETRYSMFEPGKSFFGVIKLGDVKIK